MNGVLKPKVQSIANKGVPDRNLVEVRKGLPEKLQVIEIKIMARVKSQAKAFCNGGSHDIGCDCFLTILMVVRGIGFRVEFNPVSARRGCTLHPLLRRIYKQGNPHAKRLDFLDNSLEQVCLPYRVPSRVGSKHARGVGNECSLGWPYFIDELQESIIRITFNIEFSAYHLGKFPYIVITDMPFVRAGMYGDALCPKPFAVDGGFDDVWIVSTPRIPQGGNLVNIDAQAGHLRKPGFRSITLKRNYAIMSLKTTIDNDIKKAMLAKNKEELEALRSIKSMILLAETEKGTTSEISTETENKLLMKAAKQRKESAEIFEKEGRKDLAQRENFQLEIINRYLPKQMTEGELTEALKGIVATVGAKGPQDLGKVMGMATKALAGKADGKMIAEIVKKLLTS